MLRSRIFCTRSACSLQAGKRRTFFSANAGWKAVPDAARAEHAIRVSAHPAPQLLGSPPAPVVPQTKRGTTMPQTTRRALLAGAASLVALPASAGNAPGITPSEILFGQTL